MNFRIQMEIIKEEFGKSERMQEVTGSINSFNTNTPGGQLDVLQVYDICGDTFKSYDQHYGRGLDKDTVKDGLAKFFHNGVSLRKDAISANICRVQRILHWFHSQNQLAFYASSLLFVYEGLPSSLASSPLHSNPAMKMKVGQDKEATEYNNNIQVATPWGCTNHRKGGDDDGVTQLMKSSDSEEKTSALREEDNATWKQTADPRQEAHGNGNKSERDEDGGRKNSGRRRDEEEEGCGGDGGQDDAGETEVEVRMIDFAHVFPSQSQDHGYIFGLKHLLTVLEQILCDAAHTSVPRPSS
ncbi:inositol polyphosphate multikinase-like [Melanotaenia boesemani]|uniref:inositol polyphosphate multikinase-like n=1 Tax=Melanotaenia boesemani TaxID=1250792 RepID=UPI001C04AAC5|nr:inositol polyphosphate multikinase-like [Melanotaenia boesemani]